MLMFNNVQWTTDPIQTLPVHKSIFYATDCKLNGQFIHILIS